MQDMYLKDGRNFLYVGDVGRKLVINLPNLNIIRVCYETKEGFTKDVKVENFGEVLYADIPDLFLSGEYSALTCYAIATDGEYAYTASEAHFEIKDRQKSEGYSPTEQQLITWDYIERKAAAYMQQTEIYMNHAEELAIHAGNAADSALQSKNASEQSEANARQSETNSKASEEAAKLSKTNAKASEEAAKQSEDNAQTSADNAESSADSALQSKNASSQSEANARQSEINAKASETAAKQSETNAKASEEAAKQSEDNAQASAENAESSADSALQSKNASAQSEANAKLSETNAKASETAAKQSLAEAQQIVASKADKTYVDSNLATKADKSELAVERARIDSLSTLPEGSTTGDAELIGIRIGADGVTYPNAGEAVRTQILNEKTSRETAVNELKGDLTNLDEILNVKHLRIASVTTTGSYVRAIAFSGLSLIGGHSYTFTVKPVSVTTNEYYLYFVDASGDETTINKKVDGNILYNFTPTEDMNNVSIKVSSSASSEQTFECSWIENVGDNEIDKVKTRIDNLFDGTKVVELSIINGYFVTSLSGYEGIIIGDSNSCATSFIPVRPNDKVRVDNVYLDGNRSICAYDKERNFVEVIEKDNYKITSYTFTVPENCYYVRATGKTGVAPTVTFLSIPNNLDSLRVENPIATITNGYFITRYSGLEGLTASDSESAVTDFIPVKANSVISIDGTYNDGLRCTCAYDVNKKFVAVLVSYLKETNFSKNIKIPSNARYIRITSHKDVVPTIKYVNIIIDGSNVSNPYVNGKELFDNSTIKPVLTFIDDDTWAIEYVTRQKELCDRLGIKCSFACLTEQVEKNEGLLELLLSYELEGFPIIFHANQQIGEYSDSSLDVVAEERDFVTGLQKMHKFGFSDYKIWCTPFGGSREDQKKLAYKWGFDGLVTSGYVNAYNNPYEYSSRFAIKRNSLGSNTDTTASDILDDVANIKLAIDNALECNGWVCISTHSAYNLYRNGEADDAMEEIVNYAISKGFEIRTVNEELRRRMPIYRYYEQF